MKLIIFSIVLFFQASVFASQTQVAPIEGQCTDQEIKDFMIVLRYCQQAQYSKQSNDICLQIIDEFLNYHPAIDCVIPKKSASAVAIKPYHLTEDTVLETRECLMQLFLPEDEKKPQKRTC